MLDERARTALRGPLERGAAALDRPWVTPDRLTVTGLVLGLAGAGAAAVALWLPALALWLVSRLADGLDGPLARRRGASERGAPGHPGSKPAAGSGDAGGFLDICSDFAVYGAFVVGVGLGAGGSLLPFLAVLLTYYVNGSAFLAFSSLAERNGHQIDDGRSLSFLAGLAEGTETLVVHSLWCLLPFWAPQIAWVWALVVGVGAAVRVVTGYRILSGRAARRR